jgi:hypothetical protein
MLLRAPQRTDGPRISRRTLLQRASAIGLTAASGAWLEPAQALAAPATHRHRTVQPRVAAADHLVVDYLPSQPTGLVHDTGRKDRAGKGIIDISGGIKWGWRVQPARS